MCTLALVDLVYVALFASVDPHHWCFFLVEEGCFRAQPCSVLEIVPLVLPVCVVC